MASALKIAIAISTVRSFATSKRASTSHVRPAARYLSRRTSHLHFTVAALEPAHRDRGSRMRRTCCPQSAVLPIDFEFRHSLLQLVCGRLCVGCDFDIGMLDAIIVPETPPEAASLCVLGRGVRPPSNCRYAARPCHLNPHGPPTLANGAAGQRSSSPRRYRQGRGGSLAPSSVPVRKRATNETDRVSWPLRGRTCAARNDPLRQYGSAHVGRCVCRSN